MGAIERPTVSPYKVLIVKSLCLVISFFTDQGNLPYGKGILHALGRPSVGVGFADACRIIDLFDWFQFAVNVEPSAVTSQ